MSDSFRTTPPQQQWSGSNPAGNGYQGGAPGPGGDDAEGDAERRGDRQGAVVGLLGGLLSAAGYMVYRRLPDDKRNACTRKCAPSYSSASTNSAKTSISRVLP